MTVGICVSVTNYFESEIVSKLITALKACMVLASDFISHVGKQSVVLENVKKTTLQVRTGRFQPSQWIKRRFISQ